MKRVVFETEKLLGLRNTVLKMKERMDSNEKNFEI